jgi:hypothetical protein
MLELKLAFHLPDEDVAAPAGSQGEIQHKGLACILLFQGRTAQIIEFCLWLAAPNSHNGLVEYSEQPGKKLVSLGAG